MPHLNQTGSLGLYPDGIPSRFGGVGATMSIADLNAARVTADQAWLHNVLPVGTTTWASQESAYTQNAIEFGTTDPWMALSLIQTLGEQAEINQLAINGIYQRLVALEAFTAPNHYTALMGQFKPVTTP